jgi:hypothetical protein
MFTRMVAAAVLSIALAGLCDVQAGGGPQASAREETPAQEAWQKEFEDVCSRTEDAMTFSQEELTDLIRRCDKLQPQIEQLDESRKKVFMGRLRMCRGLYAYVLDAKRNEKK